jgi:hypothetical protein
MINYGAYNPHDNPEIAELERALLQATRNQIHDDELRNHGIIRDYSGISNAQREDANERWQRYAKLCDKYPDICTGQQFISMFLNSNDFIDGDFRPYNARYASRMRQEGRVPYVLQGGMMMPTQDWQNFVADLDALQSGKSRVQKALERKRRIQQLRAPSSHNYPPYPNPCFPTLEQRDVEIYRQAMRQRGEARTYPST